MFSWHRQLKHGLLGRKSSYKREMLHKQVKFIYLGSGHYEYNRLGRKGLCWGMEYFVMKMLNYGKSFLEFVGAWNLNPEPEKFFKQNFRDFEEKMCNNWENYSTCINYVQYEQRCAVQMRMCRTN